MGEVPRNGVTLDTDRNSKDKKRGKSALATADFPRSFDNRLFLCSPWGMLRIGVLMRQCFIDLKEIIVFGRAITGIASIEIGQFKRQYRQFSERFLSSLCFYLLFSRDPHLSFEG